RPSGRIGQGEDGRRWTSGNDQRLFPRHRKLERRKRGIECAEGLFHRDHLPDATRSGHHRRGDLDHAGRIHDPDGGGGMNWMKKGPELKFSEVKVPGFLYDLFYDLKERHLLPLVALLIVAMVG